MPWIKQEDNGKYSKTTWQPDGDLKDWAKCAVDSQEYIDYTTWKDQYETSKMQPVDKEAKIALKVRIDAGAALGYDMSTEQTELAKL